MLVCQLCQNFIYPIKDQDLTCPGLYDRHDMTELSFLTPTLPGSATDQIFDAIYRAVVSLELPPGAKISEVDVASRFDVSRQPVRDAFFRLSKLGFLAIRPQRATRVTKISERAVRDAAFVRAALEVACFQVALDVITKDQVVDLRALLQAQQDAVTRDARAEFHDLDDAFHRRICEIAGHGHVWALIREQKAHMDRVRFLSLSQDGQLAHDEHVVILDALETGYAAETEARVRSHLGRILTFVSHIRTKHAAYFEDEP